MAWDTKANLRGTPGYNATGAAEDDAAIAAFIKSAGPPTKTADVLNAAYAPLADLRVPLDIWDGFNYQGGSSYDFMAETYEQYMTGVNAALTSPLVTKEQIGTTLVGAKPIWAYTAGPANAPHALIVGGSHGIEWGSIIATFRFFQSFIGKNPTMAGLRSRVRITYIPVLSADVYRTGRNNLNNLDPNRNYPFNWEYYDATDPNRSKGPTPFSEAESKAVKAVIDKYKIALVIDCHQKMPGSGMEMAARGASTWVASNRNLTMAALTQWDQFYNTGNRSFGQFDGATGGQPVLTNWAAKYLLHNKKRRNAAAMTIEGDDNLAGSVHRTSCTRESMRLYCGYLHLAVLEWLVSGQSGNTGFVAPTSQGQIYKDADAAPGTALADGGQWIKTTTATPVTWQSFFGSSLVPGAGLNFIDVPLPNPGDFYVTVMGVLEATTEQEALVEITPGFGLWTGNPTVQEATARLEIKVPGTPVGSRPAKVPFTTTFAKHFATVGDLNIYRTQLYARLRPEGNKPVILSKCRIYIEFKQDDDIYAMPRVLPMSVTGDVS